MIKANPIANLRLMAVLSYRLASLPPPHRAGVAADAQSMKQKKASRGEGAGGSSYLSYLWRSTGGHCSCGGGDDDDDDDDD
jgi:hypothetical protein